MSENETERQIPSITEQYFGRSTFEGRPIWEYRRLVLTFTNLNLYQEILDRAKEKEKGKKIVIFEIGSGREGVVGRQLIGQSKDFSKTTIYPAKPLLREEKDKVLNFFEKLARLGVGIRYLGITDARKEEQGKILWSAKDRENEGENFAYTVARVRDQTIRNFLRKHLGGEREVVDLVLAIHSLCYFTPENFKEAIRDSTNALLPGGLLIAVNLDPFYLYGRKGLKEKTGSQASLERILPWQRIIEERVEFLKGFSTDFEVNITRVGNNLEGCVIRKG